MKAFRMRCVEGEDLIESLGGRRVIAGRVGLTGFVE
jgi:hypothetical protein